MVRTVLWGVVHMNDETLILRSRPSDQTPAWVGAPSDAPPNPLRPPPWAERDPELEPTFAADADHTLLLAGGRSGLERNLRLVARDPALRDALAGDASYGERSAEPAALRERMQRGRLLRGADIDSVVDCARQDPLRPPPIALVEADLVVELDLVAMLSSTIAAALPCAGSDRELAQRVREARAVRAELPASPDACRQAIDSIWRRHLELDPELTLRLRHTVANGLAVRRAFVRDRSDGSSLVRASLCLPDEGPALPCWMEDVMLEGVTLPPRLRCVAVVALAVLPHTVHGPSVGARVLALASFVARGAGKDGGRA